MRPAASVTCEKSPPTTTVSPTTAIARTVPSSTCGVNPTGWSETVFGWAWSARAGSAANSTPENAAARAKREIRRTYPLTTHTRSALLLVQSVDHEERGPFQVLPEPRLQFGREREGVHR